MISRRWKFLIHKKGDKSTALHLTTSTCILKPLLRRKSLLALHACKAYKNSIFILLTLSWQQVWDSDTCCGLMLRASSQLGPLHILHIMMNLFLYTQPSAEEFGSKMRHPLVCMKTWHLLLQNSGYQITTIYCIVEKHWTSPPK